MSAPTWDWRRYAGKARAKQRPARGRAIADWARDQAVREPWMCAFGDGLHGCTQPRTVLEETDHPELCFFHGKIADGLMACPAQACSRYAGHKPPCSPVAEIRMTTTPDAMFSDETLELGRLLAREGT